MIPIIVVIGAEKCGIASTCRFLINQAGIVAQTPEQSDLPSFDHGPGDLC